MFQETYDFYSPSNIRIHDLDRSLRDSLGIMENLDILQKFIVKMFLILQLEFVNI